jgi:hypothetical protein
LAEELAHGQEVRIPATVLVDGEGDLELLGELDGGAGGLGIRRERLGWPVCPARFLPLGRDGWPG